MLRLFSSLEESDGRCVHILELALQSLYILCYCWIRFQQGFHLCFLYFSSVVAHLSPAHWLHLDLTFGVYFFWLTLCTRWAGDDGIQAGLSWAGEVSCGLSIRWQAPPRRSRKPPSSLSFSLALLLWWFMLWEKIVGYLILVYFFSYGVGLSVS